MSADMCISCEGRCCSTYIVAVTGFDLWRIIQAQRLPPTAIVQREPEENPDDACFRLRPNGPASILILQHLPVRHNSRVCVFLMQLRDGVRRCGIYAERPQTCRSYPIRRQENGTLAPREDLLCPDGSWAGLHRQEQGWRSLLAEQDDVWANYTKVVRAWNAAISQLQPDQGVVFSEYLDFLVHAYDLIAQQPGLLDEQDGSTLAALANQYVAQAA